MLKARKRITKRQIKEDKFVTTYFKTVDFINKNSRNVTIGFISILAIIVLFLFMARSKQTAELQASEQLAKANTEISQNNLTQAIDILLNMVDNYSGTKSAENGAFLLAYTYFQKGEYEKAQSNFEKYLDDYGDNKILTSSAYSGLAASLEQQGKFLDAAEWYEKGANKFSEHFNAPQQLLDAGRCYGLANRKDKAKVCYETLIEKYPKSNLKNDAELYLAKMSG
ncbi:MAG: tetratricopeptide repeat protein [bacterium]|jgi:TolA-binding protein|nr:tetratricopeptide repeat protein [bacterium]